MALLSFISNERAGVKLVSILLIGFMYHPDSSHSQDLHFSQYLSSPFNLNPSLTGNFKGDCRLIANYRNQWNSITVPYRTYGISGDAANILGKNDLGVGGSLFYDNSGDSKMNTVVFQVSAAYGYPLTYDSSQKIFFGLQPSLVRQQLNDADLRFDNQYDDQIGRYDPSLPSGENIGNPSVVWVTMAAGIRWSYQLAPRNQLDLGLAAFNLTSPENAYYATDNSLKRRFNIHGNYQFKLYEKIDLLPGFLLVKQGTTREIIMGSSGRYLLNGSTVFHLGTWYRNRDGGFVTAGITYQTLYVGMSYDFNFSRLRQASRGLGGFEMSIIYVIRRFKPRDGKYLSCPNYL